MVLLCGEKDAAKVVAARGEREKEGCESSSVIQSEGREGGRTILSCMLCSRYRLHVRGFLATVCIGHGMEIRIMLAKMISKMVGYERHPVFMLRTVARGVEAHASAVQR